MLENYVVHKKVTKEKLQKIGFHETSLSYDLTECLYQSHVFVTLSIAKDFSGAVANITDENKAIYPIDCEYGKDDVRDTVKRNYERFLGKMARRGVLYKKVDRKKPVKGENTETIRIKYHNSDMPELTYIEGKSDWIDMRSSKDVTLKAGEFALIDLGVSMEIPNGYEAHMLPRSSTFKNYGILMTNSMGIIDNSYSGDTDIWKMPVYATRDTKIKQFDRIAQFRIVKNQPEIRFRKVEHLNNKARNGLGSTGVK